MKRLLAGLMLSALSLGSARAAEPVHFVDMNLKSAVQAELWVSDPTPADMLGLLSLEAGARQIGDLTGLEYAANLQTLNLFDNQRITDISPLSTLYNLETLTLNQNKISDLSPLSGLTNLTELDVHHNYFTDVSPLSGLINLRRLALRENAISDISPLSGLVNLEYLSLLDTQVSDISVLAGLTSLTHLDLRNCPLDLDAHDIHIPQILANNPGIVLKYDSRTTWRMWLSSTAGGRLTDPGEGEFLYGHIEWVRLEAIPDPGFVFAGFSGTWATLENPAHLTMDQDHKIQANFQSALTAVYVDDDAPDDPSPGDPALGDPRENGTQAHPFDSIQEAIEVATEDVSIIVHPGTYQENIDLLGKNVQLLGVDPNDPHGGPSAVVEGIGAGPVVRFGRGEGPGCVLTNFIITRGMGYPAGAILCEGASPTVTNCLIVGNRATDPTGAVIYCQDSQAVLTNCTIADNCTGPQGAALALNDSDVTVLNSIVWNDRMANEILATGTSDPNIQYCAVRDGWPDRGNIHKDPLFARPGVWVNPDDPNQTCGPENPEAILMDGDYHLKSRAGRWDPETLSWVEDEVTSACIDAGLPSAPIGHEPVPNGGRINMGAYGGTAEASLSGVTE